MSHAATNWAIKQRGLKPAAKIVLWQLCDRYNPDYGCFVSQEKLADDCEMSRSALNHWLDVLEGLKLIRRETKRNPKTQRQERTEYFFPFEDGEQVGYDDEKPRPESRHGSVSGNPPIPSPDFSESRVRNRDSNPVREPVNRTVEREGRGRGREQGRSSSLTLRPVDDEVEREAAFQKFLRPRNEGGYPPEAIDDVERARRAWADVSDDHWADAVDALPRFLLARQKINRGTYISLEKYIRDAHWTRFPKPLDARGNAVDERRTVQPYSRAAWAIFRRQHDAGRSVVNAIAWIRNGAEIQATAYPSDEEQQALVAIAVGSAEHKAWRNYCHRLGFTLPMPDKAEWIFLPSKNPPHLKLSFKGYHTIEPVSVEARGPAWWWRLYQPGAPMALLLDDRSAGFVKLTMGPIPLQAEIESMIKIDALHPAFHAWETWFSLKGCKTLLSMTGPIYVPALNPAAMDAAPDTTPDYEALDSLELTGTER